MPIQYTIDEHAALVLTTVTGVVSVADMKAHYRRLAADPAFRPSSTR